MKPGGGRNKGSAFERKVAKMVIAAFEDFGITSEDCYRTPSSGGHRFAKKQDPGDLVTSKRLRRLFPFSVECKSYKTLDWAGLMNNSSRQFKEWWDQACAASTKDCKPLLVFRQNRSQAFAMVKFADVNFFQWPQSPMMRTKIGSTPLRIIRFSDMLLYTVERKAANA